MLPIIGLATASRHGDRACICRRKAEHHIGAALPNLALARKVGFVASAMRCIAGDSQHPFGNRLPAQVGESLRLASGSLKETAPLERPLVLRPSLATGLPFRG